jgi:hypothetical protein
MNIADTSHPDYAEAADLWITIDDCCAGSRQIKRKGERYLPKLLDQTDKEYASYRLRAVFFNATKRTREALTGMLMRKPPKVELKSAPAEAFTSDVTLNGNDLLNWIRTVAEQAVSTGRSVTVCEWSNEESRPYFAHYRAVDVLDWEAKRIGGRNQLARLKVREVTDRCEATGTIRAEILREYKLTPRGVEVTTWDMTTATKDTMPVPSTTAMTRSGKPLSKIPACFHNATHLGPEIGEAPLADIAEINLSHYRTSADLENGRHIAGLPTPWATGVQAGKTPLRLGTTEAWTAEDPAARFGFLEFTGAGLTTLTDAIKEKEGQMAVLGARLLFDSKRDAEAFETVKMRASSETAALGNIAGHLSATLSQALQWFVWWITPGTPEPTEIEAAIVMNTDYIDEAMPPDRLTALTAALQGNAISVETYFYQLQRGEVYPPDWDLDREVAAIAQRPPAMAPPAPPAPAPGDNTPDKGGKTPAAKPGNKSSDKGGEPAPAK